MGWRTSGTSIIGCNCQPSLPKFRFAVASASPVPKDLGSDTDDGCKDQYQVEDSGASKLYARTVSWHQQGRPTPELLAPLSSALPGSETPVVPGEILQALSVEEQVPERRPATWPSNTFTPWDLHALHSSSIHQHPT